MGERHARVQPTTTTNAFFFSGGKTSSFGRKYYVRVFCMLTLCLKRSRFLFAAASLVEFRVF
tara:strand:- start:1660 stop:1845 length:186 start_codon:yes stop_codon:yes gene_type:complete